MRLAVIRQRYTPYGGAERFVDQALASLRANGVETTLITRHWLGTWQGPVITVSSLYLGRLWRDAGFCHAVRHRLSRESFDLVQSHERIPGCNLYRAGDGVHATWLEQRNRLGGAYDRFTARFAPYHRYLLHAEAAMFKHPDLRAVICNSRMVANDIHERYGIGHDRLHVIYNAVDGERFHPGLADTFRASVRQRFGCPLHRLVWLIVGSGFQRKGVAEAIRAIAGLPEDELWIVGKDRHSERYQRLTVRLKVADRVRFFGAQDDVRPFLAAADAFLLPSWYDPFPNACLEAFACGLPVVASSATGTAELIQPGGNGALCQPGNVDELLQVMRTLRPHLRNPALQKAARATVAPLQTEKMIGEFSALYEKLLAGR